MRKVVILQHRLLHYRTRLFEQLRARCRERDIALHLVHGQPTQRELKKQDTGTLPWADRVRNHCLAVGGKDVLWQPFPTIHRDADLIVVMQENRLLSNYPWLLSGRRKPRLAYWGHGRNLQSVRPQGILEQWKRMLVGRVDWWFAYTEATRQILDQDGYPEARITVLNNAIDNDGFQCDLAAVTPARLAALRDEQAIPEAARIGLFCGSLYADKRLDFMLAAADHIRTRHPDFHLVVVGDGPAAGVIREALATRPWLKWLGARHGADKAACFRLADIVFNPGAVGLHVLDAFCAGIPMATTGEARHGPEVAYLSHKGNGLIVNGSAEDYASAVLDLLADETSYVRICRQALADAGRYSLDAMIDRFMQGIEGCLATPKKG
jgi:glycosyltransferase involved in cell wall biosynthesis